MKKRLGFLLGAIVLASLAVVSIKVLCAAPRSAKEALGQKPAEAIADDNATALTIYNQNFFVAREHVPLDLQPGVNEAQYTGVAAHLEPDSVILRDPGGRALQIFEQNYRNDPVSPEMLLSFYEGKTIDFAVGRNADGSDVKLKGKVIRSGFVPIHYVNGYPQQSSTQPIVEVDGVLRFGRQHGSRVRHPPHRRARVARRWEGSLHRFERRTSAEQLSDATARCRRSRSGWMA